jgi:hypothetical protein
MKNVCKYFSSLSLNSALFRSLSLISATAAVTSEKKKSEIKAEKRRKEERAKYTRLLLHT